MCCTHVTACCYQELYTHTDTQPSDADTSAGTVGAFTLTALLQGHFTKIHSCLHVLFSRFLHERFKTVCPTPKVSCPQVDVSDMCVSESQPGRGSEFHFISCERGLLVTPSVTDSREILSKCKGLEKSPIRRKRGTPALNNRDKKATNIRASAELLKDVTRRSHARKLHTAMSLFKTRKGAHRLPGGLLVGHERT